MLTGDIQEKTQAIVSKVEELRENKQLSETQIGFFHSEIRKKSLDELKCTLSFLEHASLMTNQLIEIAEQTSPDDTFLTHFFQIQVDELGRDGNRAIGDVLRDERAEESPRGTDTTEAGISSSSLHNSNLSNA